MCTVQPATLEVRDQVQPASLEVRDQVQPASLDVRDQVQPARLEVRDLIELDEVQDRGECGKGRAVTKMTGRNFAKMRNCGTFIIFKLCNPSRAILANIKNSKFSFPSLAMSLTFFIVSDYQPLQDTVTDYLELLS
jgi:hypothetical protein